MELPAEATGTLTWQGSQLDELQPLVEKRLARLQSEGFFKKFLARDATLWSQNPAEIDEINHRLDWMDAPRASRAAVDLADSMLEDLLSEGFNQAVVLGMGGSSLAPEVYSRVINSSSVSKPGHMKMAVLDTTDPEAVLSTHEALDLRKTLFIVSSKSGTTAEVNALLDYFWREVEKLDNGHPGKHFIAITDPGTVLAKLGSEKGFRKVVEANPNVGGRFSALIEFGVIPAVFCGFNGHQLLDRAESFMITGRQSEKLSHNPGIVLGVILAEAYLSGNDKLTILPNELMPSFGAWLEQLVAESSGKSGEGILPIDGEPLFSKDHYHRDRLFVRLALDKKSGQADENPAVSAHPLISIQAEEIHDLGAMFYIWEIAVSTACAIIGVNAFDQPNVQLSKSITTQLMNDYRSGQDVDEGKRIYSDQIAEIFTLSLENRGFENLPEIINSFLGDAKAGDYLAINAFLPMNSSTQEDIHRLRENLGQRYSLPTTLGFGPRFLHSTGQLHKGGKNNGYFIVLTEEKTRDVEIPNQGITFGKLQLLQAIGDTRALEQMGRRVIRIHLQPKMLGALTAEL